ncbi:MAG: tRNA pseudouridine(38-40) synthase TruA [Chlamydiia bacterium]|nr:tRNA pseudouridine(38-40) synthase TruA [Chlamydiia bacterium]
MKYKMTLSYDGTDFGGWQTQPNRTTIQELIEAALQTALRAPTPIVGSGRTDAGVHARSQVAHFSAEISFDPLTLRTSLNALLPKTIQIREIAPAPEDFHARYSSKQKTYHYHLHLSPVLCPFSYRFKTPVHTPLNLEAIEKALPYLLGTHDFTTFRGSGCGAKDPIKTLHRLDMLSEEGGVRLEFQGDGFLYKMVRNIMGTLLEIGTEKRPPNAIPSLLAARNRRQAGPTAPPQGLFLYHVQY